MAEKAAGSRAADSHVNRKGQSSVGAQGEGADAGHADREHANSNSPVAGTDGEVPYNDGWAWYNDPYGRVYYYNSLTGESTWDNPHDSATYQHQTVTPETNNTTPENETTETSENETATAAPAVQGYYGYVPSIHGNYDENAWYAHAARAAEARAQAPAQALEVDETSALARAYQHPNQYHGTAAFNAHTGRFQSQDVTPAHYSAAARADRQLNAYAPYDPNNHDGRSLKAERRAQRVTKKQVQQWKAKKKAKQHEKRMKFWREDK